MKLTGVEEVIKNISRLGTEKQKKVEIASKAQVVPMIESYAKQNRPWKDRTGNARKGLRGEVVVSTADIAIQLHHSVTYGVFLELSRAGKYAILRPTLDRNRAEIIRIIEKALQGGG